MKKLLLVQLLISLALIILIPTHVDAVEKDEIVFINDTPNSQVLYLKYDLPITQSLMDRGIDRLIRLNAGENFLLKLKKHRSHKYVGLVELSSRQSVHFFKIQSGQTWKVSTLTNSQEASVAYTDAAVVEARKMVRGRESIFNSNGVKNSSTALKLAVVAPERARKTILQNGLYNQYQMGSSRGVYNPELRQEAESKYLSMALQEYKQIPYDVMPKYGMVFSPSFFHTSNSLLSQYGEDIYILKWDQLYDRLTWTIGSPIDYRDTDGGFIPWNYKQPSPSRSIKHYTEFQVWGPVRSSDLESIIFTRSLPDQETLQMLDQYGIQAYDGRNGCPIALLQLKNVG